MNNLSIIKTVMAYASIILFCLVAGIEHAQANTNSEMLNGMKKSKHTTVFLVRHAEKENSRKDPSLTTAGKARARSLATLLQDAKIDFIHSSDYIRTRDTAAPLASRLQKEIEIYNPGNLAATAKQIKDKGGVHLVVGHSNTTPSLVNLLGGNATDDIEEATEYDRLYIVNIASNGEVATSLLRY